MIRNHDLETLSAGVLELYQPGLNADNYVERAFRLISRVVSTDLNGYGALATSTLHLDASFDRHPKGLEESLAAYGLLMHKYRPFRFDPSINEGRPWAARDFYSQREFHDLDIYQEVYGPMGFDDHCFVHVPTGPEATLLFGLFRAGGIFDERDKRLLALAQTHLANARRLALAQTAAEDVRLEPGLFVAAGFTPRESETLYWLTQGKTNQEIALILKVRTDTVSGYLKNAYDKLGVETRVSAAVRALKLARKIDLAFRRDRDGVVTFRVPTVP